MPPRNFTEPTLKRKDITAIGTKAVYFAVGFRTMPVEKRPLIK